MRINSLGKLVDEPQIRAGFIGCGSHSFRNIYPVFQFAPVDLVAVCDLSPEKAQAFAAKFGAKGVYTDHRKMLAAEKLDAVFIVTGYDQATGRPTYPPLAVECLQAGCHVWIEKPPAATVADVEAMQQAAVRSQRNVVVGIKKVFFPCNQKVKELMALEDFGRPAVAMFEYPQGIPTVEEMDRYLTRKVNEPAVVRFLDHLCHPASLMVYLLGMPKTLFYQRAANGAGAALFTFDTGAVATISFTLGAPSNTGMERTLVVSDKNRSIEVVNNQRVSYHRNPPDRLGYGANPNYYQGQPGEASTVWEPEHSLGQLYNKGLFIQGFYHEINEFASSILEKRAPTNGTLEQAWQITRIFEVFAQGPGKNISLI